MKRTPIKPYRETICLDCNDNEVKKTISKRCFESPHFHYQKHKEKVYAERQQNKATGETKKKHDDKSIPELLKLATNVFNRFIRNRDCNWGMGKCISCDNVVYFEDLQCGHYMPSTYSELRFNEFNTNGECEKCNCHDPNHLIGYRKNLIEKIGLEKVEWLESHKIANTHKWTKEELYEIINQYK